MTNGCGNHTHQRKPRKPRVQYNTPANSAGEAIERMLVEKKISSKINYDILKDLDRVSHSESTLHSTTKDQTSGVGLGTPQSLPSTLIVDKTLSLVGGRIPSLSSRKRSISSLGPEFDAPTQR